MGGSDKFPACKKQMKLFGKQAEGDLEYEDCSLPASTRRSKAIS